ncbi:MAG: hydrogenase maturation protease [Theionarchaea archaeon]|nr:hydrogenase maturation protease [Theionarchaea archaeon]
MAGTGNQGNRKDKEVKILILGIGNPILTDDAIGILVVQQLKGVNADVKEAYTGGIALLDVILGYDTVIIVDAVKKGGEPGTVSVLREDEIKRALHASSIHDVSFSEAVLLGRTLFPDEMPSEIIIVGIEVEDTETFSEKPTEPVERAIPEAVNMVMNLLRNLRSRP